MDTTGTTETHPNNTSTAVATNANQSPTEKISNNIEKGVTDKANVPNKTNIPTETPTNNTAPTLVSTTKTQKKRKRRKNKTDVLEPHDISNFEDLKEDDLLSEINRGPKVVEKRGSAVNPL